MFESSLMMVGYTIFMMYWKSWMQANQILSLQIQEPEYFKGRQANIMYNGSKIGSFGIVNPEVRTHCFLFELHFYIL